ncbi:hypothetical protein C2G38_574730 [Gigaspora rosea]|uniref:Uncharacterized protein n=1 Tax=Gigaspora rosea TaxID=44941 RepID=A0A397UE88_9GLOM|nr:hypothetical protein C2G38_574730 [Gigaspora rosea]
MLKQNIYRKKNKYITGCAIIIIIISSIVINSSIIINTFFNSSFIFVLFIFIFFRGNKIKVLLNFRFCLRRRLDANT